MASPKAERQQAVLEAKRDYLSSAELSLDRLLTYDKLEELTGLDRAQIAKDFGGKAALLESVVDFVLASENNPHEWLPEQSKRINDLIAEDSGSLKDQLHLMALMSDANQRSDPTVIFQMALWSLASKDPDLTQRLRTMYDIFDDASRVAAAGVIERMESWGLHIRHGITIDELSVAITAMVEGLGIRAAVDPDAVPEHLTGTVLVAMVEALICDQTEGAAFGSLLDKFEGEAEGLE